MNPVLASLVSLFAPFPLLCPLYSHTHPFSAESIPDVDDGKKFLCPGHSLRTLLLGDELLLEHMFDGVAKGRSSCLIHDISISLWQPAGVWMIR